MQQDNQRLRERIGDSAAIQEQMRRNHESGLRAQSQISQIQGTFQIMLQNNEELKKDYISRIEELTESVRRKTEDNTKILNENQDARIEIAEIKIELESTRQKFSRALGELEHFQNLQKNQELENRRESAEEEYLGKKKEKRPQRKEQNEESNDEDEEELQGTQKEKKSQRRRQNEESDYEEEESFKEKSKKKSQRQGRDGRRLKSDLSGEEEETEEEEQSYTSRKRKRNKRVESDHSDQEDEEQS